MFGIDLRRIEILCRTRVVASRHSPTVHNYKLHIAVGKSLLHATTQERGTWWHDVDGLTQCIDSGVCFVELTPEFCLYCQAVMKVVLRQTPYPCLVSFIYIEPLFGLKGSVLLIRHFLVSEKHMKAHISALKPCRVESPQTRTRTL
jgi:hypothetical protein